MEDLIPLALAISRKMHFTRQLKVLMKRLMNTWKMNFYWWIVAWIFISLLNWNWLMQVFILVPQSEIMHEAEIMAKLDHPNIVRMIGESSYSFIYFFSFSCVPFFLMIVHMFLVPCLCWFVMPDSGVGFWKFTILYLLHGSMASLHQNKKLWVAGYLSSPNSPFLWYFLQVSFLLRKPPHKMCQ